MDKGPEQTVLPGAHTEGPQTYEMVHSITSNQRDTDIIILTKTMRIKL